MHLLRVFVDSLGRHGNPLGVFLNGLEVAHDVRQTLAAKLGYSELVFIDDVRLGAVRIYSPQEELPFAGHPLVGAAWLVKDAKRPPPSVLRPPIGDVPVWTEGQATWIRSRREWLPDWEHVQLASPAAIAELMPPAGHDFSQFWAWVDESTGKVRARVFADRIGIHEDEACGSASLSLAYRLKRPIQILHGVGSLIYARPGPESSVEVGGDVVLDKILDIAA
jgi:predicted PhzF superfamily epimerase YddE/YHI9